jgi:hypothetical protein
LANKKEELWITNISRNKDIRISDLGLTIRKGQSIDLLNGKYSFTKNDIDLSISSGTIFQKRNVIKVRKVAPVIFSHVIPINNDRTAIKPLRKIIEIENPSFPELYDEQEQDRDTLLAEQEKYAAEMAEMDLMDRAPALAVDPKFAKKIDE